MEKIIVYKNVYDRTAVFETTFSNYLNTPAVIFNVFGQSIDILSDIRKTTDKQERNNMKRAYLPAMDLSQSGILAIDIDGIADSPWVIDSIVSKLSSLPYCYIIKESVSGNLVAFFKYDCSVADYPFLYYRLYLELTLLLGVTIDFLPEIGRLRYIGKPGYLYKNEDADIVTEVLRVDVLPRINASITPAHARNVKYGSR